MDDLIVIILMLVVAVVGAVGQIKKKKQAQSNVKQKNKPKDFWDMLNEKLESPEKDEEYVDNEVSAPVLIEEKPEYQLKTKRQKDSLSDYNLINHSTEDNKKIIRKERFSLRKAVIYSEILNRKYT